MTHTVYFIVEPGMDRVCVQSTEPSAEQKERNKRLKGVIYSEDFILPGVALVDGRIAINPEEVSGQL